MNEIAPTPTPAQPENAGVPAISVSAEGALHKKMWENCPVFLLLGALAGLGFSLCFCNVYGWGINVFLFSVLWLFCQQAAFHHLGIADRRRDAFACAGILLLSLSVFWTANFFVQWVSCAGIFLLMTMLLLDAFRSSENWPLSKYISAFFHLLGVTLRKLPEPFRYLHSRRHAEHGRIGYVILGVVIAVPLCAAAIGLLSSADRVFRGFVDGLFHFPRDIPAFLHTALKAIGCFFLGFLLFFCSLSAQSDRPPSGDIKDSRKADPLIAITFTGALAVIYLVFCLIQVIFLFAGQSSSLPEGYTYAEYAREGFFQLLLVSGLNLLLVLLCAGRFRSNRLLRILLTVISGCTYIMAASSAFRMALYVEAYGLTFLRVLVLWFLLVLAILLGGTIAAIYRKEFPLLRFFLTVCLAMWLAFAFARPDRITAEYNFSRFGADDRAAENALYELSMDAVPVMARYDHSGSYTLEWKGYLGSSVPKEYENHGVRSFNLALWQAFRAAEEYYD